MLSWPRWIWEWPGTRPPPALSDCGPRRIGPPCDVTWGTQCGQLYCRAWQTVCHKPWLDTSWPSRDATSHSGNTAPNQQTSHGLATIAMLLSRPNTLRGFATSKTQLAQQGPASSSMQKDGGNQQMDYTEMGGPAPQTTRPRREKQDLVVPGLRDAGHQPPRFHLSPHQTRWNSGHQQQGEGPAAS